MATDPLNKGGISSPGVLLLVDDDELVRSALRRVFVPRGYRVLTAEDGRAALSVLATTPIDVLVTDMRMPVMDGNELLREVSKRWPAIARILLTGYADLQITTKAIRSGYVDHFLTKPWEIDQIETCVTEAIRTREKRREVL